MIIIYEKSKFAHKQGFGGHSDYIWATSVYLFLWQFF